MTRGIPKSGEKKGRVWVDSTGKERISVGRPSKEELKARGNSPIRTVTVPTPVPATAKVKSPKIKPEEPKKPVREVEEGCDDRVMNIPGFMIHCKRAIESLVNASTMTSNFAEREMLRNFAIVVRKQMLPKYQRILDGKEPV